MGRSNIYREKEETYYGDYRVNFVQYKMVWLERICGKQFGRDLNNCLFVHYISDLRRKYTNLCVWSILILWICRYANATSMIYSSKNNWRTQLSYWKFSEFRLEKANYGRDDFIQELAFIWLSRASNFGCFVKY